MDKILNDFIINYAPGNHWSSKSMELSRNDEKGTYWYLKKFITFYYFVFIQKKLDKDTLKQIVNIFYNFCDSVPTKSKEDAIQFFFKRDIRQLNSIITLNEYVFNRSGFSDDSTEMATARKFYFCYLMDIEEQNEDKKLILQQTVNSKNYFEGIENARTILNNDDIFYGYVNDVHAFLRNQRQILYIQGLVNYTEINGKEEYCPTDIGKHMVFANYNEMILLMEIQKLRQVSRNPLVNYSEDINRPRNRQINETADKNIISKGHIRSHPYLSFLSYLINNKKISTKDYMFIVSRISNLHKEDYIKLNVDSNSNIPNLINDKDKQYYNPGNNSANVNNYVLRPEDFSKEYKKYVQGIFAVKSDFDGNKISIGQLGKNSCKISNLDKAKILYTNYVEIIKYLDETYKSIYDLIDTIHNEKYSYHINRKKYNYASSNYLSTVEEWLNYFVSSDTNIIRMMLKTLGEINGFTKEDIKNLCPYLCTYVLKIKTATDLENIFNNKVEDIDPPVVIIRNKVTETKLQDESNKYLKIMNDFTEERKRNSVLRDNYATYKMQHNNNICEICGNQLAEEINGNYICNYHHILPFNEAGALGPDHYLNLIGICSNCHDKLHSKIACNQRKEMYNQVLTNSCFHISILDRLKNMYKSGFLFNASLEYAVAMGMITETEKMEIINERR